MFSRWVSPNDWPWPITLMVRESRRIISYLENLTEEMMPPQSIWHSARKCHNWIKAHQPGNKEGSGMLEFSDREVERAT
jgi:hypothetical protein